MDPAAARDVSATHAALDRGIAPLRGSAKALAAEADGHHLILRIGTNLRGSHSPAGLRHP